MSRKPLLKYQADLRSVSIVLMATGMSLFPFVCSMPLPILIPYLIALYYVRSYVPFIQHNHSHLKTFNRRGANWLYDLLLTQATGYTTALWELHHCRGHHRDFLSPRKDVAGITDKRSGDVVSRWSYALRGNIFIYPDSVRIALQEKHGGRKPLLGKLWMELALQTLITALLFIWNPWLAIACVLLPNLVAAWFVWWISYEHHSNVPGTGVYDGSVTILDESYNRGTFNIGHHTAHHEKPTLHWSLLPKRTAEIRSRIPDVCIQIHKSRALARNALELRHDSVS